jgi:hypothetical protein
VSEETRDTEMDLSDNNEDGVCSFDEALSYQAGAIEQAPSAFYHLQAGYLCGAADNRIQTQTKIHAESKPVTDFVRRCAG